MATSKYFAVTVKPTIAASIQAEAAYSQADVLFDWHAFDIPKGAAKLVGVTALVRQTNGTGANLLPFHVYYAKSIDGVAPSSLGTVHATANGTGYYNNIIGKNNIEVKDFADDYLDVGVHVAALAAGGADSDKPSTVLQGEPDSGTNVGYDRLYVAGLCGVSGVFDFASTVTCTGVQPITQAVLTVGTTSALSNFAVGDILHDEDDRLLGTVKSMDSTTQMTMTANLENATVNAKDVYNISPITLILSFER
tara:strand:- start:457 stop:1209 length:753 start_codon:yes stop_codon:yes gene_type:complete